MEETNPGAQQAWTKTVHRINAGQFDKPGEKSAAFREHAMSRPGRIEQAARTLPQKTETQYENTKEWLAARPKGGGRGVAAPHQEWVNWGSKNPNRKSMAGRALAKQPRRKKQ